MQNSKSRVKLKAKPQRKHHCRGDNLNRPRISIEFSVYGHITQSTIQNIFVHYENVIIDKYAIIPNHIHSNSCINPQAIDNRPYKRINQIPFCFNRGSTIKYELL